ncbi:synaptobrevin-domain-containing protein [Nadsonia fulvescens var. elongata DSM 6958]|uniref:Synaptobrevin homolog YKT6 n=1 Tax=Nadsonia fulvescens var. elongata DSM 6958 TaxID=857566 RepID=A0A1E3PRY3_9ASCO|nr:synaptobrevin-domain-containing protein [Nadsonia fulvescens var. elongata DSM 6958]
MAGENSNNKNESCSNYVYVSVVHGTSVLSEYEVVPSNSKVLISLLLEKINPYDDKKMSFLHGDHSIHYVTCPSTASFPQGLTYSVVTSKSYSRNSAFTLLAKLQKEFIENFGDVGVASIHLGEFKGFEIKLKELVDQAESGEYDSFKLAQEEINQVRNLMVENVERVLERGERINLLVNRTDQMSHNATAFKKRSTTVQRKIHWDNIKMKVTFTAIGGGLLYFFSGVACGFPVWNQCRF